MKWNAKVQTCTHTYMQTCMHTFIHTGVLCIWFLFHSSSMAILRRQHGQIDIECHKRKKIGNQKVTRFATSANQNVHPRVKQSDTLVENHVTQCMSIRCRPSKAHNTGLDLPCQTQGIGTGNVLRIGVAPVSGTQCGLVLTLNFIRFSRTSQVKVIVLLFSVFHIEYFESYRRNRS